MIIYFSGTGNTKCAAEQLGRMLGDNDVRAMEAAMLLNPSSALIETVEGDKRVIWAFPTYSWGIPPVVVSVMRNVNIGINASAATHIMLTTCGDDMAYTDRQWRKIMHSRGLKTAGAYAVVMPNTYVLMKGFDVDAPEVRDRKLAEAPEALARIAQSINSDGEDIPVRLSFSSIKSGIIYPWFRRYAMSPKPFHATAGCISCSACVRQCPMDNITMENGLPRWGNHCALCLGCYHVCPRHAVAYGRATEGKGQCYNK